MTRIETGRTFGPCVEGEHDECAGELTRTGATLGYDSRNQENRTITRCACDCHGFDEEIDPA